VQVHGKLAVPEDREWLRALVTRLTDEHEATLATPWRVAAAPAAYLEGQLRAIVGLELPLSRVQAKWKLSQNRTPADRQGVIASLRAATGSAHSAAVPDAMEDELRRT
jgi:transcriptional regulator